ncbi:4-hydroxyphenylacetate 3-monooxygenase, reductase component [Neisseriaceae bacterium ESL0693]|nr:4-hydroxyphenylacetate 3-monooxygenase, reductase component [Neisseriaceae bacterium ESL0693]
MRITSSSESAQNYRDAMAKVASGVHVITTDGVAGHYGITMTAVTSVTDNPPTLLLCINQKAGIQPVLQANGQLCVNVLAADQLDVARHFAGMTQLSNHERFLQNQWQSHPHSNQPQLEGALAHLHGHIIERHEVGSHSIFYVAIDHIYSDQTTKDALLYFERQFGHTAF